MYLIYFPSTKGRKSKSFIRFMDLFFRTRVILITILFYFLIREKRGTIKYILQSGSKIEGPVLFFLQKPVTKGIRDI